MTPTDVVIAVVGFFGRTVALCNGSWEWLLLDVFVVQYFLVRWCEPERKP